MDEKELWNNLCDILREAQTSLRQEDMDRKLAVLAVMSEELDKKVHSCQLKTVTSLCDSLRDEFRQGKFNRRKFGFMYGMMTNDLDGIVFDDVRQSILEARRINKKFNEIDDEL